MSCVFKVVIFSICDKKNGIILRHPELPADLCYILIKINVLDWRALKKNKQRYVESGSYLQTESITPPKRHRNALRLRRKKLNGGEKQSEVLFFQLRLRLSVPPPRTCAFAFPHKASPSGLNGVIT